MSEDTLQKDEPSVDEPGLTEEAAGGADEEVAEPTLEELLEDALQRAEKAEAEIAYRDATIQNVRKKGANERAEALQFGGMNLARRMLGVLDATDRALANVPEDEQGPVVEGLRLLRERLWQELSTAGVSVIEAEGVGFDPNVHEAITTVPASDENPVGSIVDVLEPGYRFRDKLLRAARVVVSSE